jgi:hypothetical protein
MSFQMHKLVYADGRAYQYHIVDEDGQLRYVAERTGMLLPTPTALTEFFDPDHSPIARLQPPEVLPWQRATRYELLVGPSPEAPQAVIIEERFRPVDAMLLRLPMYELHLAEQVFIARGSRYGGRLYEIFRPCAEGELPEIAGEPDRPPADLEIQTPSEEWEAASVSAEVGEGEGEEPPAPPPPPQPEVRIGRIERPSTGPSYIVEAVAAPLREALLPLAALAILIDIELYS